MRMAAIVALGISTLAPTAFAAGVTMEKTSYGGWDNCVRLANGEIELIATTDVGPRIIRLGFVGGPNLFKEYADLLGKTGGDEWRIYGGHRFWHAPEAKPRTYWPDNSPVEYRWDGRTLVLTPPPETPNGVQKVVEVVLAPDTNRVTVRHRLVNVSPWAMELAPWALTVMAPGGRAIFPQEPYIPHTERLLPGRPMVLWNYTDMADPRWTWGRKYVQLRQDPTATTPQKAGLFNSLGWAAYTLNDTVFIKRYDADPGAVYPDWGCNTESFTNQDMLEVESLGPLTRLAPNGGTVEHVERWYLFKAAVGETETAIDSALLPLVERTQE